MGLWGWVTGLAICAALAIGAAPALAQPINLICTGASAKDETVGAGFLSEGHSERIEQADSIVFVVRDDGTGEARLPRRMQSAYKEPIRENWFRLVDIKSSDDEIIGRVRLHGMYKPRFRLDRLTGLGTVNGNLGSFSGQCEPYDPDTVERKF